MRNDDRPPHLSHKSSNGVYEIFFEPTPRSYRFRQFIQRACHWGAQGQGPSPVIGYLVRDVFLSSLLDVETLAAMVLNASSDSQLRILLADPGSPFAIQTASWVQQNSQKEALDGLGLLVAALSRMGDSGRPYSHTTDYLSRLDTVRELGQQWHTSLRFFAGNIGPPLFGFNDILVCGTAGSDLTPGRMPWTMVVDDPHVEQDLYDIHLELFDRAWRQSTEMPQILLSGRGIEADAASGGFSDPGDRDAYYSCFISYAHVDKPFARYLRRYLLERGIECWVDEHQMLPGDDLADQIYRGIQLWSKVLLCCSKASLQSSWVEVEIDTALEKERKLRRENNGGRVLTLIPLDLDGYVHRTDSGRAAQIRARYIQDFRGWEDDKAVFTAAAERVAKALCMDRATWDRPPE